MKRKLTFEQACAAYVHRYTMDHVPAWARAKPDSEVARGDPVRPGYYAPQYRSDREWYDNTVFPGEQHLHGNCKHCETHNQTWPLGHWLQRPFRSVKFYIASDDTVRGDELRALIIDRARDDCGSI